ncbi:MAG: EAL domain-containing protein [Chloroflexi bacterium]|nr:EAL domain-containing protein [Chloroflexota bacterium]
MPARSCGAICVQVWVTDALGVVVVAGTGRVMQMPGLSMRVLGQPCGLDVGRRLHTAAVYLRLIRLEMSADAARLGRGTRGFLGDAVRDWGAGLIVLLTVFLACYLLWHIYRWGGPEHKLLIGDLALLPTFLVAAALAWRASAHRSLDARTRRAWFIMGSGLLLYSAGQVVWLNDEAILGVTHFPSLANIFHAMLYPILLWGMLSFPMVLRSRSEQVTFWLDVATVLLGGSMVMGYFIMNPQGILQAGGVSPDPVGGALLLSYAMGDLVLFLGIVTLLLRQPHRSSADALRLLIAGLIPFFAADLAFLYLVPQGAYHGGDWPDILLVTASYLMALGAAVQYWTATRPDLRANTASRPVRPFSWMPYAAIAIGYGLLLVVARDYLLEPLGALIADAVGLTALVVARQITAVRENARLLAAHATRRSEARFSSLVQNASDVVLVVGSDTIVRYQTPSVERVLGYPLADLDGASVATLIHPDDAPYALAYLGNPGTGAGESTPVEWRLRHQDGRWLHMEVIGTNLLSDPNVRGIVLNGRDISERKALETQLTYQAFHDPLTGLANRALFKDRVDHALARGKRHGRSLAVLFLDLDDFKTVNDSLGHAAGDELLVAVSERLRECLRAADTAARLGGDEFAILLEDTAEDDARILAERMLAALTAPFLLQGKELFVSASIGLAVSARSTEGAVELLRNADAAMYTAKGNGKAGVEAFEPGMHQAVLERLALRADLQRALDHGELLLHYQPTVDLASGCITGYEALIRWEHPERGTISPLDFIPLAEETGLILSIGRWALREACRQARRWQARYPSLMPIKMGVNLSARQLLDPDLIDDVAEALVNAGLEPRSLVLEITESLLMQDTDAIIDRLHALKRLGVRLAIDDFGTGYSSLSYLRRFPVDILKIDKTFVDGLDDDDSGEGLALVRAIVDLSHALSLETVAEGIERAGQLAQLFRLGCVLGQGYYFSRPLPGAAASRLLAPGYLPAADRFTSDAAGCGTMAGVETAA